MVLLGIVFSLLTGCIGGGKVQYREITLSMGGFPSDKVRYIIEVATLDEHNNVLEIYQLAPTGSHLQIENTLAVDTRADSLAIYLLFAYPGMAPSTSPSYLSLVPLEKTNSQYSIFYWLSCRELTEHRYRFGKSESLLITITEPGSYPLNFGTNPYYFLEFDLDPDLFHEVTLYVDGSGARVEYGSDITYMANSYSPIVGYHKFKYTDNLSYMFLTVSNFTLPPPSGELRVGTTKTTRFSEDVSLIATSLPDVVLGLTDVNLHIIDPFVGEITKSYILPYFTDWTPRYFLDEDVLLGYYHNYYSSNIIYFIWDLETELFDLRTIEISSVQACEFDLSNRLIYMVTPSDEFMKSNLIVLDMDTEVVISEWLVDEDAHKVFINDAINQIYIVNSEQMTNYLTRYLIKDGQLIFEERIKGSLFTKPFSEDRTAIYFLENNRIVVLDAQNFTRKLDIWDEPDIRYIAADDSLLYHVKQGSKDPEVVHIIDMQSRELVNTVNTVNTWDASQAILTTNSNNSVLLVQDGDVVRYLPLASLQNFMVSPSFYSWEEVKPLLNKLTAEDK